jgi:predicted nicotinamide N-methyase
LPLVFVAHFRSTSVSLVGLQIWRGALLLADYLLDRGSSLNISNAHVLELAAGTGITSIVAAAVGAKSVLCTDVDRGKILDTIRQNFADNASFYPDCDARVAEIDFFKRDWWEGLSARITRCNLVLVADVVYNQEITTEFFSSLELVLTDCSKNVTVLVAIERRNRIGEDGKVTAPNFEHFLRCLDKFERDHEDTFSVEKISLDFHQHFQCYNRVNELNLWQICRKS